ncbi:MAG: hypothetical protein RJA99_4039 [Pseudomonadota bacterium]|jgi:competence protein ComEA
MPPKCLQHALLAAIAAVLSASALAAVDANTASAEALESVSGIGPAIAKRIVDERRKGPYRSLDDLQARVRGVGEAKARRLAAAGLTVGVAPPVAAASRPGTAAAGVPTPAAAATAPARVIVGGLQGAGRP